MVHRASLRSVLALLIVVSLCAACGSSDSSKVSAASYVSSVCSAIAPLEQDVVTRSAQLKNTAASNAAEAKRNLRTALHRNPDDRYANDFLATLYQLDGNTEAALKYWNRLGKPSFLQDTQGGIVTSRLFKGARSVGTR